MRFNFTRIVFIFLFTSFFSFNTIAEGSKDLMSDISSRAALSTVDGTFAAYNSAAAGNERKRLNIHIENPLTEKVYLGFSKGYSTGISDILGEGSTSTLVYYFRILDPNGNVVFGPQAIDASNAIPSDVIGYNQVKAGPAAIVGASGYTGFSFTPAIGAVAGDYYIEFNKDATTFTPSQCSFDYWDITVANISAANPVALPGRIWANQWGFYSKDYTSGSYSGIFKGKIYSYTPEGFVNKVDFSGSDFRGGSFLIGMNSTGPGISGNVLADRQSIYNVRRVGNEYKLFLNNPDIAIYPTGDATPPTLSMASLFIACGATTVPIGFTLSRPGKIEIILDFNGNGIYDIGTRDIVLAANGTTGSNIIIWDRKDGQGNIMNETDLALIDIKVKYELGVHHISLSDIEFLSNGFTVEAVRPLITPGFVTKFYWDDTQINSAAFGNKVPYITGPQPNVVELGGVPVRKWDNFTDNATPGFGNSNSINTWWNSYVAIQSFKFTVQSCTLPVKLISFDAALNDDKVMLTWITESELNFSHFVIEKSTDGNNYIDAGLVFGNPGNSPRSSYTFTDKNIPPTGILFYRLRSIDLDGKIMLSDIRIVRMNNKTIKSSILIFPNPASNEVRVTVAATWQGKIVLYEVINGLGQTILKTQKSQANQTEIIGLDKLKPGFYIVKVTCEGESIQQKIIKQ